MPRRTTNDYKAVLKFIKGRWPLLSPKTVICDFEKALHRGVEIVFDSSVQGCYFHFTQVYLVVLLDI